MIQRTAIQVSVDDLSFRVSKHAGDTSGFAGQSTAVLLLEPCDQPYRVLTRMEVRPVAVRPLVTLNFVGSGMQPALGAVSRGHHHGVHVTAAACAP